MGGCQWHIFVILSGGDIGTGGSLDSVFDFGVLDCLFQLSRDWSFGHYGLGEVSRLKFGF